MNDVEFPNFKGIFLVGFLSDEHPSGRASVRYAFVCSLNTVDVSDGGLNKTREEMIQEIAEP